MTDDSKIAKSIQIAERIRVATETIIKEELKAAENIPASVLLNAVAANVGATIDIIEARTGGQLTKPHALGLVTMLVVQGMDIQGRMN